MLVSTKCRRQQKKGGQTVAENKLRGRIISRYHTVINFAKVMKWSSRKAYDIVNGKQDPTGKEIQAMCLALDVQIPEDMKALFFSP